MSGSDWTGLESARDAKLLPVAVAAFLCEVPVAAVPTLLLLLKDHDQPQGHQHCWQASLLMVQIRS